MFSRSAEDDGNQAGDALYLWSDRSRIGFERVDRRDDDLLNDAFKKVEGWSGQKGLNHDPIRPYLDNHDL